MFPADAWDWGCHWWNAGVSRASLAWATTSRAARYWGYWARRQCEGSGVNFQIRPGFSPSYAGLVAHWNLIELRQDGQERAHDIWRQSIHHSPSLQQLVEKGR